MRKQKSTSVKSCPFRTGGGDPQGSLKPEGTAGPLGSCMALAGNTPIPTPEGWIPLHQVAPGQTVFDQAGQQRNVEAVSHRKPEPVFRVSFDDESCLIAGAQHPWVTLSRSLRHRTHKGRFAFRDWAWDFAPPTAEQIRASLIHKRRPLEEAMHSVPVGYVPDVARPGVTHRPPTCWGSGWATDHPAAQSSHPTGTTNPTIVKVPSLQERTGAS